MEKYNKYKHIFSGVDVKDDIIFLKNKCPIEDYPIIDSIISGIDMRNGIGYVGMNHIISKTIKMKYRNDIEKYLIGMNITHNTSLDQIQLNILDKIKSRKTYDTTYLNSIYIDKSCPHCGLVNKATLDTSYIVCGVDSSGMMSIDFNNGCLNDWCFVCGKKLCKNWCFNSLHDLSNRHHTKECCRTHAMKNNFKYPDDYCVCGESQLNSVSIILENLKSIHRS